MKKGQIAMEVLAYIGFLVLVFVLFSFYLLLNFNSEIKNRQYLLIREQTEQIAQYFLFVLNSGPGTTLKVEIPSSSLFSDPASLIITNNGWIYFITGSTDSETAWFSYSIGFRNFTCSRNQPLSLPPSCFREQNSIKVDLSKGWIFLNYTSNQIEVE